MPFLGVYGSGGCLPAWNAVNRIFAESSNRKNRIIFCVFGAPRSATQIKPTLTISNEHSSCSRALRDYPDTFLGYLEDGLLKYQLSRLFFTTVVHFGKMRERIGYYYERPTLFSFCDRFLCLNLLYCLNMFPTMLWARCTDFSYPFLI